MSFAFGIWPEFHKVCYFLPSLITRGIGVLLGVKRGDVRERLGGVSPYIAVQLFEGRQIRLFRGRVSGRTVVGWRGGALERMQL